MGAELLRHQGSIAHYDNNHSRFMWGLLHFLDFDRHRRHKRKMLAYRRNTNDKHGEGTEIFTLEHEDVSNDREHLLNKHEIFQAENKTAAKRDSGSAHPITLLYKKLTKKKDRKLKNTSSAAQLRSPDYVLHDEMASDSDSSTAEQNSQVTDIPASSEQGSKKFVLDSGAQKLGGEKNSASVPRATEKSLLRDLDDGKIVLDRSADLEQKIKSVIKEEHRISMDGVLDKIPFGHKVPDDEEPQRSKFGREGFISTNSKLAHRSIQRSRSLTESLERYSSLFESRSVREPQRIPQRSISVKEQDNNSAQRRFLRSHSLSESLDRYTHLLEFISVREPQRPRQRSNPVEEQENKFAHGRVLRSRSLSESFDRYHLLESISVKGPKRLCIVQGRALQSRSLSESVASNEPRRLTQRSNSVKEQDSSFAHERVVRSRSLSDSFDRYPNLIEPLTGREPKRQPERLKSIREDESLQGMKSQTEVSALLLKKPDSSRLADDDEADACSSDEPDSAGNLVKTDTFVQHDAEIKSSLENSEFTNEHDQGKAWAVSDDRNADDSGSVIDNEFDTETDRDASDEPQTPSTLSVLDGYLDNDAISPAKYAESQGPELQPVWIHSEEQDSVVDPESRLVDGDPGTTQMELNRADSDMERTTTDASDIGCFRVKEEAEFNFVRNVLKKSGFGAGAEEFLAAWYSSYDPVDQLLFVEDPETMTDDSSDLRLDPQLLFDLMDEVLLEIYASTIANSIGLSRFNPRVRPVPVGDHLLEEVWAKVSWHRSSQQGTDHAIEHVEARDYAKNDGWMNLQWDVERVVGYLEGLTFDSLIDEVVLDIVDV